jgi:hypothetical protein
MTVYEIGMIAVDALSLAPKQRMKRGDLISMVVREAFQGDVPNNGDLAQIRAVVNKLQRHYPSMIGVDKISPKVFELYRL